MDIRQNINLPDEAIISLEDLLDLLEWKRDFMEHTACADNMWFVIPLNEVSKDIEKVEYLIASAQKRT